MRGVTEGPFTGDELRRFGAFLEALGRRLQHDEPFRRALGGETEAAFDAVAHDEAGAPVAVEFHESEDALTATVSLPPGTGRDDVRVHATADALEVVIERPRPRTLAFTLPVRVQEGSGRATYRNNVLDVVMRKAPA